MYFVVADIRFPITFPANWDNIGTATDTASGYILPAIDS